MSMVIIIVRIGIVIAMVMGMGIVTAGIVMVDIVMVDIVTGILVMATVMVMVMVMGIDIGIIGMEATPAAATRDIVVMEEVHGGVDGDCFQHERDIPIVTLILIPIDLLSN